MDEWRRIDDDRGWLLMQMGTLDNYHEDVEEGKTFVAGSDRGEADILL